MAGQMTKPTGLDYYLAELSAAIGSTDDIVRAVGELEARGVVLKPSLAVAGPPGLVDTETREYLRRNQARVIVALAATDVVDQRQGPRS